MSLGPIKPPTQTMLHSSRGSRVVACLLLGTMSACHTWQPYRPVTPADTELPTRIRFSLDSGESIELTRPRLEGDSVYVGEVSPLRITRVPVASVVSMESAQVAVLPTTVVVVGVVALALVGFSLLVEFHPPGPPRQPAGAVWPSRCP